MGDLDGNMTDDTTVSSSATLTLPIGARVLRATVIVGQANALGTPHNYPADEADFDIEFGTPAEGYTNVLPTSVAGAGTTDYLARYDVTSLVNGSGVYFVANQPVAPPTARNVISEWLLLVIYELPGAPLRAITEYGRLSRTCYLNSTDSPLRFTTPATGTPVARLTVYGGDGHPTAGMEQIYFDGVPLSNPANPPNQIGNKSVSDETGAIVRNPMSFLVTESADIDVFDVSSRVTPAQTDALLTFECDGDGLFWLGALFSVDVVAPDVDVEKSVVDLDGGAALVGDILEYTVDVETVATENAINMVLVDTLPPELSYVAGSLRVASGANTGVKTEAAGDDQGEVAANVITVRLGTGADDTDGGTLNIGQSTSVVFRARIDAVPASGEIRNQANIRFGGASTGTTTTYESLSSVPGGTGPTPTPVVVCLDDAAPGALDTGCSAALPICDVGPTPDVCVDCVTTADCGGGVCNAMQRCVPCVDDMAAVATDTGCDAAAPICTGSGASAVCAACVDDIAGGVDTGCAGATPVCAGAGAGASCVTCEDNEAGATVDFGCAAPTALCDDRDPAAPTCAECITSDDCAVGTICGPASTCVAGCDDMADCAGTGTPICDLVMMGCVECLTDADCPGVTTCEMGGCRFPDADMDGTPDDVDLDDDNDGVLDRDELGGTDLSADADGDGVPDYLAPSADCMDTTGDGLCDSFPPELDLDEDGIPNHLDLDADGDGVADLVEAGGDDADGDGIVDDFADTDGDGVDDDLTAAPLPVPDTDDDSAPDFLDLDSDDDGVDDATEGHDDDGDGTPDAVPSGADTDGDGIDDAFDPSCAAAADCGGVIGAVAPRPDHDEDGDPDIIDADDDGDGIPTATEVAEEAEHGDPDMDGTPAYLDTDSDDDGAPDLTENGFDLDEDGVPDYLDPDSSPADSDDDGLADLTECPPPGSVSMPETCPDTDGDGLPDFMDTDDDGDGIRTRDELPETDTDGDGLPNHLDLDDDDDGIPTAVECPSFPCVDTDGDGVSDHLDLDSDDDSIGDGIEGHDVDGDGVADVTPSGTDTDNDGLDDAFDPDSGGVSAPIPDRDGDGAPDYQDADDDGDGIPTLTEAGAIEADVDGDGTPNYLDLDSDDDGATDAMEGEGDDDGDGVPNYLDPSGDTTMTTGGVSGGALCATGRGTSSASWLWLLVGAAVWLRRRR